MSKSDEGYSYLPTLISLGPPQFVTQDDRAVLAAGVNFFYQFTCAIGIISQRPGFHLALAPREEDCLKHFHNRSANCQRSIVNREAGCFAIPNVIERFVCRVELEEYLEGTRHNKKLHVFVRFDLARVLRGMMAAMSIFPVSISVMRAEFSGIGRKTISSGMSGFPK